MLLKTIYTRHCKKTTYSNIKNNIKTDKIIEKYSKCNLPGDEGTFNYN